MDAEAKPSWTGSRRVLPGPHRPAVRAAKSSIVISNPHPNYPPVGCDYSRKHIILGSLSSVSPGFRCMSLADQDDALIRAALEGSARAWDNLVRRYESQVYNFSLRLTGNPTDALDLMQDVFLGVYRNLHRFRGDSQFTTWLFRIAHNKAIDMNRRRPLCSSLDSALEDGGDLLEAQVLRNTDTADKDPLAMLDEALRNAQIIAQLGTLPLEQRLIVELKVFQSHTFEEIAELQDISANTAKTRFYTALRKLKALMEQDHAM